MNAAPSAAQVGTAVSVFSDYRFRGYSLSESRPVAILDLSLDAPSGLYGSASGSVVAARGEGIRALGLQLNGGYAARIHSGLTIDVGAVYSTYSSYSGLGPSSSYAELYAGLGGKRISSRVSVSPDYFGTGWTVHGEITGQFSLARNLRAQATVGTTIPIEEQDYYGPSGDGAIGLEWTSGRISLHGAITTRRGGRNFYPVLEHSSRTAAVVGFSYAL